MRVVNQSIGRALRHKNDFSVILLFDERFARNALRTKLSKWAQDQCEMIQTPNQKVFVNKIRHFFEKLRGNH